MDQTHRILPEDKSLVCLALMSCCGRTDLLQQSVREVTSHMGHDEHANNVTMMTPSYYQSHQTFVRDVLLC